ncbi:MULTISPECIES: cytochrome c oxidase subunit I [Sorangium]|uniref:Cytochrome c oxidase subunit 1 n=1 Tax=Sorangium cellulosum TaxID=56 RepID=A0A4P2R1P6_SORCE|nr:MULTISPECIES: cytochrome c oxidase subunit I [Sorangium]AUX36867.1 cytochrome C oxidase subunit I [Sorangium cellulosum]WCQ96163.1 Cytochrome c oxidase polypeptide I+III [Sorangium sp. Soce836]
MSQTVTTLDVNTAPDGGHGSDYIRATSGIMSWLTTVDHKRIGLMYLVSTFIAFLMGGVFALVLRLELLTPKATIISANAYNQMFTLHGAVMTFLFIIPSIPGALGNFLLPIMIGAKDVAFPKLNLLSLYLYWIGALFTLSSLVTGGIDTGWTFYVPYSSTVTTTSVLSVTFGVFILGFSSVLTGLNFVVTLHKLRAPGMGWYKMPLMLWALYATSIVQILATPVLGITLLLLIAERAFHIGIFDPALGGDPVLYQHFFWFYSHPAVYIMILPGMGIISELISVHARRRIFGYKAIAFSSVAIALVGFLVWGHHMFTSGQSELAAIIFSFLTFLVAIPSGVKVFNWTATLWRGSISFNAPMLYALSFLILFSIGGLTGVFLGMLSVDLHLHDTYFVVAHFHYVMVGGTVIAYFGGLHHWWPKITGKMYSERLAAIACVLVFIGFNVTFFTQFVLGSRGMPRRYYNYLDQFQPLHAFSTVGSWILGAGILVMLVCLIRSLRSGAPAPKNPWGGLSLEWTTASPPITENFVRTPIVTKGAYDFNTENA